MIQPTMGRSRMLLLWNTPNSRGHSETNLSVLLSRIVPWERALRTARTHFDWRPDLHRPPIGSD